MVSLGQDNKDWDVRKVGVIRPKAETRPDQPISGVGQPATHGSGRLKLRLPFGKPGGGKASGNKRRPQAPAPRMPAHGAPATLKDILDKPRTPRRRPTPEKKEDKQPSGPVTGESLLSRRRLRVLAVMAAVLCLAGTTAAAAYFNAPFQSRSVAAEAVQQMLAAPSYKAVGVDTTSAGSQFYEAREQFSYAAPNSLLSRFTITSQGMQSGSSCTDTSIVVIGSNMWQKCNKGGDIEGWQQGPSDGSLFSKAQFRPWIRLQYCDDLKTDHTEEFQGAQTSVVVCTLSDAAEKQVESGAGTAEVSITAWIREKDHYIARFAMIKKTQSDSGIVQRRVDYVYSDFGMVGTVEPPEGGSDGAGPRSATPVAGVTGSGSAIPNPSKLVIDGHVFNVEVADTDVKIQKGLSGRSSLPLNQGMLFVFPEEGQPTFWMKGMRFDLDVIFLDSDGQIVDIQRMPAEPGVPDDQLLRYRSALPAMYVLEINGGLAQDYGIRFGSKVEFRR